MKLSTKIQVAEKYDSPGVVVAPGGWCCCCCCHCWCHVSTAVSMAGHDSQEL